MNPLDQIKVKRLKKISVHGGDVLHALKTNEESFQGFGEAYFSWVDPGAIKAWKQHLRMTLNLIVPVGLVRFVFYNPESDTFREECIGALSYSRITVNPKIWFGFQGLSDAPSLLLNLANLTHDPKELIRKSIEEINYSWK